MPLVRAEKEALVEKLVSELTESRVSLIIAYTRLNMKANDELRTSAFEKGAKIKMLSNNLLRLILKKLGRGLDLPEKTLALAYGYTDEVDAAKSLVAFGKETETLEILGGWIDGSFFDTAQVKTLSSLPGKEQLQAQLVGRLGGLIGSLAYNLNYPLQKFAFVVAALEQKGGAPAGEDEPVEEPKKEEAAAETSANPPAEENPQNEAADVPAEPESAGSDNASAEPEASTGAEETEEVEVNGDSDEGNKTEGEKS
jgi:large subunit ribosomal protein L10